MEGVERSEPACGASRAGVEGGWLLVAWEGSFWMFEAVTTGWDSSFTHRRMARGQDLSLSSIRYAALSWVLAARGRAYDQSRLHSNLSLTVKAHAVRNDQAKLGRPGLLPNTSLQVAAQTFPEPTRSHRKIPAMLTSRRPKRHSKMPTTCQVRDWGLHSLCPLFLH